MPTILQLETDTSYGFNLGIGRMQTLVGGACLEAHLQETVKFSVFHR